MRELETSLQQFGEFILKAQLDIDFDQGLVFVRGGKGDKDRSTLLAEAGREELRAQLQRSQALHRADRASGLNGVWLPDTLDRMVYTHVAKELRNPARSPLDLLHARADR